jgi:hypothetical protein
MRIRHILCGIAVSAFMVTGPAGLGPSGTPVWPAAKAATASVDINLFFSELEPYGSWVETGSYPYVWVPGDVGPGWSPYTNGHWLYTDDYGWYFESDEPFAPIAYHYGRWAQSPDIGWYWVPGTEWAPAWVSWRHGGDRVGWAPLPPPQSGYAVSFSVYGGDLPQPYWNFVPYNQFLAPQLSLVVVAGDRDPYFFRQTTFAGPVRVVNNRVVNNAIKRELIEERTKRRVIARQLERVSDPRQVTAARRDDQAVKVFDAKVNADQKAKPRKVTEARQAKARQVQARAGAANQKPAAARDLPGARGKAAVDNKPKPGPAKAGQPPQGVAKAKGPGAPKAAAIEETTPPGKRQAGPQGGTKRQAQKCTGPQAKSNPNCPPPRAKQAKGGGKGPGQGNVSQEQTGAINQGGGPGSAPEAQPPGKRKCTKAMRAAGKCGPQAQAQ